MSCGSRLYSYQRTFAHSSAPSGPWVKITFAIVSAIVRKLRSRSTLLVVSVFAQRTPLGPPSSPAIRL